jgi:hypothetical protein
MEHPALLSVDTLVTPPPILWAQNPYFLEVTGRDALQNIENKEVPCKIFQDKELRDVFGLWRPLSADRRREETCRNDGLKEDF